ncbi:hypothetical protein BN1723_013262 [Verticillium longisporum]|uniref:Uncharacterized protein n=1 Tax=Verticillium longisporum TaxID=100787 RepID=A0A0G4LQX4_VERLO|nr:hypothetical protein BN1723_013262 [Verticillium longisporum]
MGLKSLFRRHDDDNDEASSSNPPPSYSDADKGHNYGPPAARDAPSYERPTYPVDSTIVPATLKFPPRLNVYLSWKSARTFHLGTSGEEKLFAVSTSWAVMGMKKPLLTIYDGPEKTDPVLAETSPLNYTMNQRSTITLPPGAATNPGTAPLVINLKYEYSLKTIVFSFTLAVPPPPSRKGDPPQEEAFEWRSTFGDETDPVLAETSPLNYTLSQRSTITLPPGAATDPGAAPLAINLKYEYSLKTTVFSFTLAVPPPPSRKGDPPQEEAFEWRSTFGDEVKHLTGGSVFSSGWKLVRLWGPENRSGAAGPGFASDGKEIVAVLARSMSASMTKSALFAFMGTGLTGQMGAQWELVALASAIQMWWAWTTGTVYTR